METLKTPIIQATGIAKETVIFLRAPTLEVVNTAPLSQTGKLFHILTNFDRTQNFNQTIMDYNLSCSFLKISLKSNLSSCLVKFKYLFG